jgi:hypothetical protein
VYKNWNKVQIKCFFSSSLFLLFVSCVCWEPSI